MSQTRIPLAQLDSSIGAGGAGTWGSITGTLSAQTDLQTALNAKLDSDATLTALAGQNWALNSVPVGSGADTVAQLALTTNTVLGRSASGNVAAKPVTDLGFTLINNATTLSMQTTIGVVPGGTYAGQSLKVVRVNTAETALELATLSGLGTVTNTGGVLTSNAVVLGNASADVKVIAGITTDGVSQINLGVNATTLGKLKLFGNTSGDVTLQPNAVAGTGIVLTLPATTGTLLYDGGPLGTPASGVATNLTGTAAGLTAGTASAVAVGGITGLGTGVATALAVNVGSAGAFVTFNGAGGTPSSMTATNLTGTAAGLTAGSATALATSRNLWGQAFTGAADVTGSLTSVIDITGGASSMVITAGTGNSRTLTLRTTTSGGTATTALTLSDTQAATFAESASAKSLAVTGTAGAGFAELIPQSSAPAAPASGLRAYADSTGRFAWIRAADGFNRTFDGTLTASRVYTLPDFEGTVIVETAAGNITGGASSMVITAGTGNSRTLTFRTTTSGGVATTAFSLSDTQIANFAGPMIVTGDIQTNSGNLKLTSDTTIARSAVDKIAVNSKAVPLSSSSNNITFNGNSAARTYTLPDEDVVIAKEGLAGTKIYWVSDTSGGAVNRKLTFVNGILTLET